VNGVVHLDPRLADGRSSAAVLAEPAHARPPLGADWLLTADAVRLEGAARAAGDFQGLVLPPSSDASPVRLRLDLELDAERVDAVELRYGSPVAGRALLRWRDSAGGGTALAEPVAAAVRPTGGDAAGLRFVLRGQPRWSGPITALWLEHASEGGAPLELFSVHLLEQSFAFGDEPLDATLAPRPSGDGGLVRLGLDARRSWPSDWGVPLFDSVRVPRGGRLVGAVGLAPGEPAPGEVRVAIDARAADGGWERVHEERVALRPDRWHELSAALDRWAGERVELRLVAGPAGAAAGGTPREVPERARVLWAAPLVLGELARDRRPNLVLVTLDTTRADAFADERRFPTPFLDALAREGLRFEAAYASANSTQPSHASILSGLPVRDHGVLDNYSRVPAGIETLTERLRAAGYHTAAAVSQPCLGLGCGFGQGFDHFLQPAPRSHLDGARTLEGLERWLATWREEGERPLFLWLHLFDPHTPYTPPAAFVSALEERTGRPRPPRTVDPPTMPVVDVVPPDMEFLLGVTNLELARHLYAAGVAYADELLARAARAIEPVAGEGDTVWLVTADHGESLGERNSWFNHRGLYPETVHVPLVLRLPERFAPPGLERASAVERRVSTLDVAPTLLALGGAEPVPAGDGLDLVDVAAGRAGAGRRLWFEHGSRQQIGFVDEGTWFVTTVSDDMVFGLEVEERPDGRRVPVVPAVPRGTHRLYDRAADPGLERDLSAERPERLAECLEALSRWEEAGPDLVERMLRALSPADEALLEGLGYTDSLR